MASNTNGASVVTVVAIPSKPGDCINDGTMTEVVRRLRATVDINAIQNTFPIVQSPTPPQNTQSLWQQTDPSTGVPIGGLQIYDSATGAWKPQFQSNPPTALPETRKGYLLLTADGAKNITFAPVMPNTDYIPVITTTTFDGTSYSLALPAVGTPPHIYVINRQVGSFSIHALQVPAGGIGIFWRIQ